MAGKSRFIIAESTIKSFFNNSIKKVFSFEQLAEILEQKRTSWNLPISTSLKRFISQLENRGVLEKVELHFEGYLEDKVRYKHADATVQQIANSLINKSYLSHYTAVFYNGLTTQIPKTIYLTFEQSKKNSPPGILSQDAIDNAFSKPQRIANTKVIYEDYTILVHNGMFTNRAGVYTVKDVAITNIERTLIDIAVRPSYSGGVSSVIETYKRALPSISINKLNALLENMKFVYPYHQSIGFYLEKAGMDSKKLHDFRSKEMKFDFFLTYAMGDEVEYSKEWKLYYPKGI